MEVEKFKQLMFDESQYCIFQHLPKPLIYNKNMGVVGAKRKFGISQMEAFWRKPIGRNDNYLLYMKALENMNKKDRLDYIDSRLLEMVSNC